MMLYLANLIGIQILIDTQTEQFSCKARVFIADSDKIASQKAEEEAYKIFPRQENWIIGELGLMPIPTEQLQISTNIYGCIGIAFLPQIRALNHWEALFYSDNPQAQVQQSMEALMLVKYPEILGWTRHCSDVIKIHIGLIERVKGKEL